jgi:pimeloyl-ACP methyl ester carboxylesterase
MAWSCDASWATADDTSLSEARKGVGHHVSGPVNVVLVHGAWADGSCWSGVIQRLQAGAFQVRAPQFRLTARTDDVARLRQVLDFQDGPAIVIGHPYGRQIITAPESESPNVVGLVHLAAFGLDEGESVGVCSRRGRSHPHSGICSSARGATAGSPRTTSSTTSPETSTRPVARVMHAVRQAVAVSVSADLMRVPAWKSLPPWYLVAQNDEVIPPDAKRLFASRVGATTVEVPSGHVAMVSHPQEVTDLIEEAAARVGRGAGV